MYETNFTPIENTENKQRDADLISFAAFCGKLGECGYNRQRDVWLTDDVSEAHTEDLLKLWKKQQIPRL